MFLVDITYNVTNLVLLQNNALIKKKCLLKAYDVEIMDITHTHTVTQLQNIRTHAHAHMHEHIRTLLPNIIILNILILSSKIFPCFWRQNHSCKLSLYFENDISHFSNIFFITWYLGKYVSFTADRLILCSLLLFQEKYI